MNDPQLPLGFDAADLPEPPSVKPKAKSKPQPVSASTAQPSADPVIMAAMLDAHPDYRVIRRLEPTLRFDRTPQGPVIRVVVLDTETTGLDQSRDKIIELALLRVDVDTLTGLPVGDVTVYDALEDPGVPISKEIQAITGITDEMVQGHQLDDKCIEALLADVDLVIAHNASFDRPFCEARIPAFTQIPWGCSLAGIDWKKEGYGSAKLEFLAMQMGWFYDAHRAEVDCHALLAVLGKPLPVAGQNGMAKIIATSEHPSYRLQANGAPFDAKDILKARSYRWNAEQKVWHTRLSDEAQLAAELQWLKAAVYNGRAARVQVEKFDARVSYSNRAGEIEVNQL